MGTLLNETFYTHKVGFLDVLPNWLNLVLNELHTNCFLHNNFGDGLKVEMFASLSDMQTKLEFFIADMLWLQQRSCNEQGLRDKNSLAEEHTLVQVFRSET